MNGLILKGIGGFYEVYTQTGNYTCKARGVFRKRGISPLPGDHVVIQVNNECETEGSIEEILPRKNAFVRPPVSNIDQMVIVVSVSSPQPDFLLVDKLLITAEKKGIKPLLCINKVDLGSNEEVEKIHSQYKPTGYEIISVCAKTKQGLDTLLDKISFKCTALAGQSGVGKSTILNTILKEWVMETGCVSDKIKRGKHTTRHVQLLPLACGGFLVDTPGFSSFELEDIMYDELEHHYPEFSSHYGQCRFSGCNHINEPGCSVKNAVESGDIDKNRYKRFTEYWQELKTQFDNRYRR